MLGPVLIVGAALGYYWWSKRKRASAPATSTASSSTSGGDFGGGGATSSALTNPSTDAGILSQILAGVTGRAPGASPVRLADWYTEGPDGYTATQVGQGQMNLRLANYTFEQSIPSKTSSDVMHVAVTRNARRDGEYPTAAQQVRILQQAGGVVFVSKKDVDALRADISASPSPLYYFSVAPADAAAWAARMKDQVRL